MGIDLNKIKNRLAESTGEKTEGGNNMFWKAEEAESIIRILPSPDDDPFKKLVFHYNLENHRAGVLCPKRNFGDACPICDFASNLWKEGEPEGQKAAKKLFPKERYYSVIVVRGKESEGPKIWGYNKEIYESLLAKAMNPDWGDFTDPATGNDVVVRGSKAVMVDEKGQNKTYIKSSIDLKPKPTKLMPTQEETKALLTNLVDIFEQFTRETTASARKILDEHLNAGVETSNDGDVPFPEKSDKPKDDIDSAIEDLIPSFK